MSLHVLSDRVRRTFQFFPVNKHESFKELQNWRACFELRIEPRITQTVRSALRITLNTGY